jgi:uncharacterized membrane protein
MADGTAFGKASARVAIAFAVGSLVAVLAGYTVGWSLAIPLGWDCMAAIFLLWTWWAVHRMDADQTASHATREDPTRAGTQLLVVSASVVSLLAVGFLLARAADDAGNTRIWVAGLGVLTVALAWLVIHCLFALRYARLYYLPPVGGIGFNQEDPPNYSDFAYLAFSLGMTFQVSDTAVSRHSLRMTVLRHALLSYLFGTFVLATAVNLVASLTASGR